MSAPYGLVKGGAIRAMVVWYESHHDAALLRAVARALPPQLEADLDPEATGLGVLANRWYDARVAHLLLDATMARHPPAKRDALLAEGCRVGIEDVAKGVYGLVITKLATPALYAKHINRMWRMLHDSGERTVELEAGARRGAKAALSTTRRWRAHHPIFCRMNQHTMATLLTKMGCADVAFEQHACVSDGDDACTYRFTWG